LISINRSNCILYPQQLGKEKGRSEFSASIAPVQRSLRHFCRLYTVAFTGPYWIGGGIHWACLLPAFPLVKPHDLSKVTDRFL